MRVQDSIVVGLWLAACSTAQPPAASTASSAPKATEPPPARETALASAAPASPVVGAAPRVADNPQPLAAAAQDHIGSPRTFDGEAPNAPPRGFSFARTGGGRLGRWHVHVDAGAHVLAQLDDDATDDRYPVAVSNEPVLRDVAVSVRCKLVAGKVDRACGIVARYGDERNYYITRANALEDNVRLYTVRDGARRQIASWKGRITAQTWHDYRFELRGDHLQVFWDGQRVLDHRDPTFSEPGRAGVWTKADSITYFDDFHVEAL
jgi:hypothetical protein